MSKIELKHIDKYYGKNHVLKDINLVAEDGDFLTLLGPSGCGKTTTLRVVAGLENPQGGDIYLDGKNIVNAKENYFVEPGKRGMDLVFQSYALWPHMTVYDNVAFGLVVKKQPKDEIRPKVMNALERMRIAEFAKRYPSELSGGQQQRVAIARSIVSNSNILLLDEPLSNLDAKLRIEMRSEIKRLHHDLGTTILYVTHDQVEALTMSTKIAIFFDGCLEQVAAPM
ncbi:MAG: ABC transporter ATP-binding protein, partial [Clostridiales bacterium]|nr:ABC transporter ATP-binding protein [Clostridiales bacterium]